MTEVELRELDAWIAEKFMGWTHIPNSNPLAWVDYIGKITTWETTSYGDAFRPTRLPAAFALVKREIEARWKNWYSHYEETEPHYWFKIYIPNSEVYEFADSEELAGCLAVKAAIEGMA